MPVVVLTGFPCSGKTRRADELAAELRGRGLAVAVLRDQHTGALSCASTAAEKVSRGLLRSEVERSVSREGYVIVDAANYIKGFRYELYCVAKAVPTPLCVLHCLTSDRTCRQWNAARARTHHCEGACEGEGEEGQPPEVSAPPAESADTAVGPPPDTDPASTACADEDASVYPGELLDALIARYEFPDSRNRWEKPLFTVEPGEAVPVEAMLQALRGAKVTRYRSTQAPPVREVDFVQELDRVTQAIVQSLLQAMGRAVIGDRLAVPEATAQVHLLADLSMPKLRRLRRQFLEYCRKTPPASTTLIGSSFVAFLNASLAHDGVLPAPGPL